MPEHKRNISLAKKVLFVAPSAYPLGGVQTWLDYILPGLASDGWDPILGLVSGRLHDAEAYLRVHPFDNVHIIPSITGTRQGRRRSLMKAIEETEPDFVIILNIADAYMAAAQVRLERNLNLKIIATLRGYQPDYLQDFESYRDHLDAIVCSGRLGCALVENCCGLASDRVFYAPGGVEIPDARKRGSDIGDNLLKIAYVGRMENEFKRIHDVIDIMEKCLAGGLNLHLTIAGEGTESINVMETFSRKGLSDHVRYLGVLDQQQVRDQVYAVADVLLLTSSSESGPHVAWEAMAEGLVLVTSDYLGRRCEGSLQDDSNCCVFPVGDAEKAVDCLRKMQDRGFRDRISASGRELVARRYSREAAIETWSECLHKIGALRSLPRGSTPTELGIYGNLDRLFGSEVSELIRRLLLRKFKHSDPGGEWPHSYGNRKPDDPDFWKLAQQLNTWPQDRKLINDVFR